MANPTLTNYLGATLSGLISANASAIATDFGILPASATDPDKLATAILERIRDWLIADGTNDPGLTVENFNNGAYTKVLDINRLNQVGYQLNFTTWNTDANPPTPNPDTVV